MAVTKITQVSIPQELAKQIDQLKGEYSRNGFVRLSIKKEINLLTKNSQ